MDMEMVVWIAIGWFAAALVLSIALGGFLGQVNTSPDEDDLASALAKRKGMRFMRVTARSVIRDLGNSQVGEVGRRRVKGTG